VQTIIQKISYLRQNMATGLCSVEQDNWFGAPEPG
jgi:hypothetical protein